MNAGLPRVLRGVGERPMHELSHHLDVHGPLPDLRADQILGAVQAAGLRGHGGAGFPAAIKLRSVAGRRGSKVLLVNATEGEPASKKDRVLLRDAPHLVLDGAAVAARAVGASQAILAVSEADARGRHALAGALAQRPRRADPDWTLTATPDRYLIGQETALVNFVNGGPGLPTFGARPFQRGVRGRPTLVHNAETLAHLALIARHGPSWFRALGTPTHPGSTLVSVSGAVSRPGVYEIEAGMALAELMAAAGEQSPGAYLVGGYFGTWLSEPTITLEAIGAGVIVALPRSACPVAENARLAEWYAQQSAGQCGACVNGLGAIAHTISRVAVGAAARSDLHDLRRWAAELAGRGACQHPDGASRLFASALTVFSDEFAAHARHGRCGRCAHPAVLPVPRPLAQAA